MRPLITALALAAASGSALAGGIETQTVEFDYTPFEGGFIDFEQFDTQGGTRILTGVSLQYDQTIDVGLTIESNGFTALNAGDWLLSAGYNSIHQFGLADGGEEEEFRGGDGEPSGPPFNGPGAVFQGGITGFLGASDGAFGNGGPDTYNTGISETFSLTYDYDASNGQAFLDAFSGPGTLNTVIGGFSELFFEYVNDPNWGPTDPDNPPPGPWFGPFAPEPFYGVFVTFDEIRHFGDITVTFEYETVPAPASSAVIVAGALAFSRRRRR